MTRTSTTILGAIALALFAFIVLYERQTMSTAELRGARNQLLERFVRTRVDGVEIERDGEVVASLRREREEGDMLGTWRVVSPFQAAADDDAVSSMLGAVQYAAARSTLEETDAADLERFGILEEITGRKRGRVFSYRSYLTILNEGTDPLPTTT